MKKIAQQVVGTDIYIEESWFTVLKNGGNVKTPSYFRSMQNQGFNMEHQRFALVYYLDVGRQDSSNPGYLKFYDRSRITFKRDGCNFSGNRYHSVNYDGTSDRIIIGINFGVYETLAQKQNNLRLLIENKNARLGRFKFPRVASDLNACIYVGFNLQPYPMNYMVYN